MFLSKSFVRQALLLTTRNRGVSTTVAPMVLRASSVAASRFMSSTTHRDDFDSIEDPVDVAEVEPVFLSSTEINLGETGTKPTLSSDIDELLLNDPEYGHIMSGYIDHLDDMIDKTEELKDTLEELRLSKRNFILASQGTSGIRWMDNADILQKYEATNQKKSELTEQHKKLLAMMAKDYAAKQSKIVYAVDSPDGEPDGQVKEQMEEIKRIMYYTPPKTSSYPGDPIFAVDAPDGDSDGHVQEELEEIRQIIDHAAAHEDKAEILRQHQLDEDFANDSKKIFAVDGPDGGAGLINKQEEMKVVRRIIDHAAVHEDKEEVLRQHQLDDDFAKDSKKVFAVDGPEGDMGLVQKHEDMKVVSEIIDHAARYEDKDEVLRQHQLEDDFVKDGQKVYAVDGPDGDIDLHEKDDMNEIKQIIDYAAAHEDKDKIIAQHKLEEQVLKQRITNFPDY